MTARVWHEVHAQNPGVHPLEPCDLCGHQHTHVRDVWDEDGTPMPLVLTPVEHQLLDAIDAVAAEQDVEHRRPPLL